MGLLALQDNSIKGALIINIAMTTNTDDIDDATTSSSSDSALELLLWMQKMLADPTFSASNPALVSFMRILDPCFNRTTYVDPTSGDVTCDSSDAEEEPADRDRPSIEDVQLLPPKG